MSCLIYLYRYFISKTKDFHTNIINNWPTKIDWLQFMNVTKLWFLFVFTVSQSQCLYDVELQTIVIYFIFFMHHISSQWWSHRWMTKIIFDMRKYVGSINRFILMKSFKIERDKMSTWKKEESETKSLSWVMTFELSSSKWTTNCNDTRLFSEINRHKKMNVKTNEQKNTGNIIHWTWRHKMKLSHLFEYFVQFK